MKPHVERMGLEEEHPTGKKKGVRGRPEGLCSDGAKAVAAGLRAWLCPQGIASSGLSKQAELLPVHCTFLQLPRDCVHGSALLLLLTLLPQAGWAGSASEAAKSSFLWEGRPVQAAVESRQALGSLC